MTRMTALINETRERISFAVEGVALGAAELVEGARDRILLLAALVLLVAAALLLVVWSPASQVAAPSATTAAPPAADGAQLVKERGYTLSLPAGWSRSDVTDGALFAAASADGRAQTTLWAERNPDLSFSGFVADSLGGLQSLGTDARISDRVIGPTLETSSAQLRAEVPLNGMAPGPYRVDLRAAGPYRFYLATSIAPGAPARLLADVELLGSSLRPQVRLKGLAGAGNG